jgi:hypothetical protein
VKLGVNFAVGFIVMVLFNRLTSRQSFGVFLGIL